VIHSAEGRPCRVLGHRLFGKVARLCRRSLEWTDIRVLFLDAMSRPVAILESVEYRGLWYWNPQDAIGGDDAGREIRFQIRKSATANVDDSPTSGADPPGACRLLSRLTSDEGFSQSFGWQYALSETSPSPAGAYGFFARLTSNQYGAVQSILWWLLNNGVFDYGEMGSRPCACH